MTPAPRVGRIVGLLLLVLVPTGLIVPYILLLPLTPPPAGFLEIAADRAGLVRFNVLLLFLGGLIPVAISTAAWPIVRERGDRAGLWLASLAAANLALQVVENAHWLTLLSVSEAYAEAGAGGAGTYPALGIAVRAAWRWAHYAHILVVVGWLFTLHAVLFRSGLAPRALAAAGMAAAALHVIGITLPAFAGYRMPASMLFGMPLGFATLAVAAWLMVRGFSARRPAGPVPARTGIPAAGRGG